MRSKRPFLAALIGILAGLSAAGAAAARTPPLVRLAELEIDPAQLDAYKAALAEEVEASVRLEPGVLALNAVSIGADPARIRLLEIYASQAAYEAHLKSPHFVKYKVSTAAMVRSLTLIDAKPLKLCGKAGFAPTGAAGCL